MCDCARRNEWWVPGKIVEAREQLQHFWKVHTSEIPYASPVTLHEPGHHLLDHAHRTSMPGGV